MFFDPLYFLIVMPFVLLSMWAAAKVKGTFAKYEQVPLRSGRSGLDAARLILQAAGVHDVTIEGVGGDLSDHYDPRVKRIRMSQRVLEGRSAAAVAVAAHEVGHALQHAQGYAPIHVRAALVPLASIGSRLALPLIIFGFLLQVGGLVWIGIIAFSLAVLFQVVTLPVEFDASRRAIAILERSGIVAADELPGVRKTLYAAGFTYVAAALTSLATLFYFLLRSGILGGRGNHQ